MSTHSSQNDLILANSYLLPALIKVRVFTLWLLTFQLKQRALTILFIIVTRGRSHTKFSLKRFAKMKAIIEIKLIRKLIDWSIFVHY